MPPPVIVHYHLIIEITVVGPDFESEFEIEMSRRCAARQRFTHFHVIFIRYLFRYSKEKERDFVFN